jgi:hypothetical protein
MELHAAGLEARAWSSTEAPSNIGWSSINHIYGYLLIATRWRCSCRTSSVKIQTSLGIYIGIGLGSVSKYL